MLDELGPVHMSPRQVTDPGVNFVLVNGLTPITVLRSIFERRVTRCTKQGNPPY